MTSLVLLGNDGLLAEKKIKLEKLELISRFPLKEQGIFLKTTPKIVVDISGNVYALDNKLHTIFKFDKNGNFVKKIGGNGQGPGELQYPFFISLGVEEIYILDNLGVSIFDTMGRFTNRFRTFRLPRAMGVFKFKVLLSEANSKKLITMYDQSGKMHNSFGDIYKVDHPLLKRGGRYALNVDFILNWGGIVCSEKYIYFVSSLFGAIFKFDQSGNLIKKKEIEDVSFFEKNKKYYFSNSTIKESKDKGLPLRAYFNDVLYFEKKIYLLLKDKEIYGEIWQLDENLMAVERKYSFFNFQEDLPARIKSKSIGIYRAEDNNNLNYYISLFSSDEIFLNVYKSPILRSEK
jgi:hypothetical protein